MSLLGANTYVPIRHQISKIVYANMVTIHCFTKRLFKINIKLREEKGRLRASQEQGNKT